MIWDGFFGVFYTEQNIIFVEVKNVYNDIKFDD